MYLALITNGEAIRNTLIWRLKIPLKNKKFMWYLQKEVVLTNDNLAKKNWNGGKQCCFCHANETVKHLFFDCYYAKFMWGLSYLPFNIIPPRTTFVWFMAQSVSGKIEKTGASWSIGILLGNLAK
jgi:hypothetical protein